MRNVLVVSTVEYADAALRGELDPGDTLKVVVPVVSQGFLDWLANDQRAFTHAEEVADELSAQLPGEVENAGAGEADVLLAIQDALATFPADEIIVALPPGDQQGFVESMATANTPTRSVHGIPVRVVVIDDPR